MGNSEITRSLKKESRDNGSSIEMPAPDIAITRRQIVQTEPFAGEFHENGSAVTVANRSPPHALNRHQPKVSLTRLHGLPLPKQLLHKLSGLRV
ncbi:MAG: hypothetical protein ACK5YO_04970, partial [Planctomyces sp.]